jgi:hypothetical protein
VKNNNCENKIVMRAALLLHVLCLLAPTAAEDRLGREAVPDAPMESLLEFDDGGDFEDAIASGAT